jgi:cytochrome P450 family 109
MSIAQLNALPEQIQDRMNWFQHMRESSPVYLDPRTKTWQVFRYEDVSRVVSDYAHFSQVDAVPSAIVVSDISFDAANHRQWRGLLSQALMPQAIQRLTPRITQLTQDLLDQARPKGAMDVMQDLAYPLVVTIIAEILGLPVEQQATFRRWSDVILYFNVNKKPKPATLTEPRISYWSTMQEMSAYFAALIAERRQNPKEDAISGLVTGQIDGKLLSEREIISNCMLLLVTGMETSSNLLGNAILCFDACPEALDLLRHEPGLMPDGIEEVLRFLPATSDTFRITTSVVLIGDQRIPANEKVRAWIASANRDQAQFTDPDRFDIKRNPNPHLSFGHGIHYCFGAPLARLLASLVLPMMLEQLPGLRRAQDKPLDILDTQVVFVVKHLPVTFQTS